MVHYYGDRRHRLNLDEVPLVRGLILEKLADLYEERRNLLKAEEFYRIIHRMDHNRPGRPEYPEPFTWSYLGAYLEVNGPLREEGEDPNALDHTKEEVVPGGVGREEAKQ